MADSNARRDKALESIAGSLGDILGVLKKIERNTRRTSFTNHNQPPDPFDVPEVSEPDVSGKDERPHSRACGPRIHAHGSECHENCPTCGGRDDVKQPQSFVQSSHPYFRPSAPVTEEGSNAID